MNLGNWTAALIALSAAAAVLLPLAPKSGTGRLLRLIVTLCFIGVLIAPLSRLFDAALPELLTADESQTADPLDEALKNQVERQINAVLTDKANEALAPYRLKLKKAAAKVDIDGDNGICIKQVVIYPDRKSRESPTTLVMVLGSYFGTEVVMGDDG